MVFLVVMYGCETWTRKKAEHWRTDVFELWCCRRLLRVRWTARRSNQSILIWKFLIFRKSVLNIHWKDWCWGWSSNTLATWWEEMTHWKRPWCWERLKAGGEGDNRGCDGQMASPARWTWIWADSGVGDGQGNLACCSPWGQKELDTTEWLNSMDQMPWSSFFECWVLSQLYHAPLSLAPRGYFLLWLSAIRWCHLQWILRVDFL